VSRHLSQQWLSRAGLGKVGMSRFIWHSKRLHRERLYADKPTVNLDRLLGVVDVT
jgi:hypothetical protein